METLIIYLGKTALTAGAFYMAYMALFMHQKHFVFNRIYLPGSFLISFIIPLCKFTSVKYVEVGGQAITTQSSNSGSISEIVLSPSFSLEWHHYLFGIYLTGVIVFIILLLVGYIKASKIIDYSENRNLFGSEVCVTDKDVHPFSFFSKIVISKGILKHPKLEMIINHEKIHVCEKHTIDIIFTELLFIPQWFNPFAWLFKDAVKNNLEYKTDHLVAKHFDSEEYQLTMVALAHKKTIAPFLTALNGSQLKNRIIMMKKKTENKFAIVKQLVVLPLTAILVMGLSTKEVKTKTIYSNTEKVVENVSQTPLKEIITDLATDVPMQSETERSIEIPKKNVLVETIPNQNSEKDLGNFNKNTISQNERDSEEIEPVKSIAANFEITREGEIENANTLINKVFLINGKVVAKESGKPIAGVTIKVKGSSMATISDYKGEFAIKSDDKNITLQLESQGYLKEEIICNGKKEVLVELKIDKNSTIPNKEARRLIWKNMLKEAGIEKYPEGEEPILIIDNCESLHNINYYGINPNVVKSVKFSTTTNIDIKRTDRIKYGFVEIETTLPSHDKVLYIIDGEEVFLRNQSAPVYIYPKQMKELRQLSKEQAVEKYGKKAMHGAIEITTKSGS